MSNPIDIFYRFQAQCFRLLPTRLTSRAWGKFTRSALSKYAIFPFAKAFKIDFHESEKHPLSYATLNDFFTRRLKPGSRPIEMDESAFVSPVDGRVSAFGRCDHDRLMQVKNIEYNLFGLLRDGPMSKSFENGFYMTIYLSPHNYHRVHAPCALKITGLGYMPGNLVPVNGPSVRWIEQLYTQNERLIVYAQSPVGTFALVMVGAHFVGSMSLAFHDFVTNRPGAGPRRIKFERSIDIDKGDELGIFEMGSTVVLLMEKDGLQWDPLEPGTPVLMGQKIASL
jgi:phosphatidylserine decarboxylase